MAGHQIYVEETSWYSEGGEKNYGGGFHRWSKRYKELTLEGPHKADNLLIKGRTTEGVCDEGLYVACGASSAPDTRLTYSPTAHIRMIAWGCASNSRQAWA